MDGALLKKKLSKLQLFDIIRQELFDRFAKICVDHGKVTLDNSRSFGLMLHQI